MLLYALTYHILNERADCKAIFTGKYWVPLETKYRFPAAIAIRTGGQFPQSSITAAGRQPADGVPGTQ